MTRTPIALATALLIAAPGAFTGGSPIDHATRLYSLSGLVQFRRRMSPMSPHRGKLVIGKLAVYTNAPLA